MRNEPELFTDQPFSLAHDRASLARCQILARSSGSGHRTRHAAGRRQITVLHVVHHHPVRVESPGQGPKGVFLPGDPARGATPSRLACNTSGTTWLVNVSISALWSRSSWTDGIAWVWPMPMANPLVPSYASAHQPSRIEKFEAAVQRGLFDPRCHWLPVAGADC